jgi:hypothetical protein
MRPSLVHSGPVLAYHGLAMVPSRSKWVRSIGSCVCLFAAMAIYAPQALIGWWAGTGACCKSEYCPIPEHHRTQRAGQTQHRGMECDHDAAAAPAGLAPCAMSCCHQTERALMSPMVFVLNVAMQPQELSSFARVTSSPASKELPQSFEPLSPPPRLAISAA